MKKPIKATCQIHGEYEDFPEVMAGCPQCAERLPNLICRDCDSVNVEENKCLDCGSDFVEPEEEFSVDMRGVLAPKDRKTYVFGGKSTVTILNPKSGNRFTFKVKRSKPDSNRMPVFYVRVLTGPNNDADYRYIGLVNSENDFVLTPQSAFDKNAPSVKAFVWFIKNIESELIEVWHEGVCGVCGRKLTVPESIERGIGPVCEAKGAA